jgi:hypothetical protein
MGALALALGGTLASASPAVAEPTTCFNWTYHPDRYTGGGISFQDGTAIRRGPYAECALTGGRGYPGHGIDVHCYATNGNGVNWIYVRNTTTGGAGWANPSFLNGDLSVVPRCYQ